jgi:CheY-like chemotaxis protein
MAQATTERQGTLVGGVPTVLIVDDEPSARKLLRAILEQLGVPIRIEEAADADSAMDIVRRTRPDLVLLDIVLPDSRASGVILCRVLSSDPRTQVVIVSGNANESLLRTCLSMGALDCVRKPFSVEQMRSKLARWLAVPAAAVASS